MIRYNFKMLRQTLRASVAALGVCIGLATPELHAEIRIVTSIKPVHSLVSVVTGEDENLIVARAISPHGYRLRPSDARAIEAADVIIWLGPSFESFLKKPLANLPQNAQVITLMNAPGLNLLRRRSGVLFEDMHDHGDHAHEDHDTHEDHDAHEDHDDHEDHEHETSHLAGQTDIHDVNSHIWDPHIWLDPENAAKLAEFIAERLGKISPNRASDYRENAARFKARLLEMSHKVKTEFAAVQKKPFLLSHDATLYFERYFGLKASGSITLSPDINPGARRIRELRGHIAKLEGPVCIFSEPNMNSGLQKLVGEGGRDVHTGLIDPEGIDISAGADHVHHTFLKLSRSFLDCFQK